MFFYIALALLVLVSADSDNNCRRAPIKVANFERTMITQNIKKTPATFAHILDANHSQYKASGFATPAQIAQMDRDAFDHYYQYYGLNVTAGIPVPQYGGYLVKDPHTGFPIGLEIPYTLNDESYRLVFDSLHPERSCEWWRITNYGTIIQMLVSGVFPGGKAAGTRYYADSPATNVGDIVSYNYYHFTKKGSDPLLPGNMERFLIRSNYPARQTLNSQGQTISVITEEVVDEQGRVGCACITSNAFVDYETGGNMLVTTNVMRWPCPGLNPLP